MSRPVIAWGILILGLILILYKPLITSIFSWEHIVLLCVATALLITSVISGRWVPPDVWKGEEGKIQPGSLLAVVIILFTLFNVIDGYASNVFIWLMVAVNTFIVICGVRNFRKIRMVLDSPEQTYKFPNGISFSYPGKYMIETDNLDGLTILAELKDKLTSMGIKKYRYESIYDLQAMYQKWKGTPRRTPEPISGASLSFSVISFKNETGQTTSDIYLRVKNSSMKILQLARTTFAGREALLHEEFGYDGMLEQDTFYRTVTVLFDDYIVSVESAAYDKNKIDECRAIAEGIENSLKFSAMPASEWSRAASSYESTKPQQAWIEKRDNNHYLALGLQRGATKEEIHAAFQRMKEKYHPDNDPSLDAQMKFHEARQAYGVLLTTVGGIQASESSDSTAEAGQRTTYNHDSAGFSDTLRNHPEFKELSRSYARVEPENLLRDYFFRWKFVLAVIVSIAVIFIFMRYLTQLPFTHESSVRLFIHTAVFVFISWLIHFYVHFTAPRPARSRRSRGFYAINLLGVVYICLICFVTLPYEFHYFWHYLYVPSGRHIITEPYMYGVLFAIVLHFATYLCGEDFEA